MSNQINRKWVCSVCGGLFVTELMDSPDECKSCAKIGSELT